MIYIKSFNNASEFQSVFGLRECGEGNKSRMNKILLGCLKDRKFFRFCAHTPGYEKYLSCTNMADFKVMLLSDLSRSSYETGEGRCCLFSISGVYYGFRAPNMEVNDDGLCHDGDTKSIRYRNLESDKIYKMKAGKFFTKIINNCEFGKVLPQQAKSWLGEEFLTSWQAFAEANIKKDEFEFHYGNDEKDFERIYSSYKMRGDFSSCMTDDGYHTMFANYCKCHAAWLTDINGDMFARCVIWDEVHDEDSDKVLRLAERQYSDGVRDRYKKMLVDELIKRDLIDGYKQIGASCHDNRAFVLNDGTSLADRRLWIDCDLDCRDTVSYMDSFVNYDINKRIANNWSCTGLKLNTTDGSLEEDHENDRWSDHYDEWIPEDEAYYVSSREDYYFEEDVVEVNGYYELKSDCVEDHNGDLQLECECVICDECGEYVLESDAYDFDKDNVTYVFCDKDCMKNLRQRLYEEMDGRERVCIGRVE